MLSLSCFVIPVNAEEVEQDSLSFSPSYLDERYTDDLSKLKQRKIIRALVVPGRTDFYIKDGKITGLIVKLLDNYEKNLNKGIKKEDQKTRIVYIPVDFGDLIPDLLAGKGDIAAGFLTITDERKKLVAFASSHKPQAECKRANRNEPK